VTTSGSMPLPRAPSTPRCRMRSSKAGARAGDLINGSARARNPGTEGRRSASGRARVFLACDASLDLPDPDQRTHDPWRDWNPEKIAALAGTPWYTLRRIDPFTIRPLKDGAP